MDKSLSNFELKNGSDSEHGSDKSEPPELLGFGETDQSSSNGFDEVKIEDFDQNLPETVTLLVHEATGAKVYLVGTAHFSKESQDDVEKVIKNVIPHVVVLELCNSRINILSLDEQTVLEEAKNIDLQKIIQNIRKCGAYNGIMYLLLLNMSANITKQIGMAPGGEFRVAYKEAIKLPNCELQLGDRPIGITLQRALARLSWFQTIKLAWHLITSNDTITVEDIEKCKKRDMLEQVLVELAGEYPALREVFLEERDIYLTNSLQSACNAKAKEVPFKDMDGPVRIVGVVGIGHAPGIQKLWNTDQRRFVPNIITIPPPSLTSRIIKFTYKASLLTFAGYLVYRFVPIPRAIRENGSQIVRDTAHYLIQKWSFNVRGGQEIQFLIN